MQEIVASGDILLRTSEISFLSRFFNRFFIDRKFFRSNDTLFHFAISRLYIYGSYFRKIGEKWNLNGLTIYVIH